MTLFTKQIVTLGAIPLLFLSSLAQAKNIVAYQVINDKQQVATSKDRVHVITKGDIVTVIDSNGSITNDQIVVGKIVSIIGVKSNDNNQAVFYIRLGFNYPEGETFIRDRAYFWAIKYR